MKKKNEKPSNKIRAGNIENRDGTVVVSTGNVTITEIHHQEQLFSNIYHTIEARPETSDAEKEELKAEVKEVEEAVKKPKVDENFVSRRLRNIGRMAPDILEVILVTITSPAAGLGMVGKKIAEKAKGK